MLSRFSSLGEKLFSVLGQLFSAAVFQVADENVSIGFVFHRLLLLAPSRARVAHLPKLS
jgi:hypothetical protein